MGIVKNAVIILEEIGRKNGLVGEQLDRYVRYILARWPRKVESIYEQGYLTEWAERFKNEREYEFSDSTGQKILAIIDIAHYMNVI